MIMTAPCGRLIALVNLVLKSFEINRYPLTVGANKGYLL